MKLNLTLSLALAAALSACGGTNGSSSAVKDDQGTVNDLPHPILKCVETQDGAVVLDGRVEATIAKDQFSQLSAKVVQRDQFSGDSVLGEFLDVEEMNSEAILTGLVPNVPDLMYIASASGKHMTLSLWKDATDANKSIGTLFLKVDAPFSERSISLACKKS